MPDDAEEHCWLCNRPLGRRLEYHHPVPKSRGGRETVPVHPICHRAVHNSFTNKQLEQLSHAELRASPEIARFLHGSRTSHPTSTLRLASAADNSRCGSGTFAASWIEEGP